MLLRTVLIPLALMTCLGGSSCRPDPLVTSRICPPYPEMPVAAKTYLQQQATVDPDGDGLAARAPVPRSEPLWNWLSDSPSCAPSSQACPQPELATN